MTITTTITFSGGYTRGPWLAVTRNRMRKDYALQWYWTNGAGGARYNPPLSQRFATKRAAEAFKRAMLAQGAIGRWEEWPPAKAIAEGRE